MELTQAEKTPEQSDYLLHYSRFEIKVGLPEIEIIEKFKVYLLDSSIRLAKVEKNLLN